MSDWQLTEPLDAVIFDCDGTLSRIEGIDELARHNGVGERVIALTEEAMSHTGITPEIFHERLKLVDPTKQQLEALGQTYYDDQSQDAATVVDVFHALNKTVYVVSAGNNPAVEVFADRLGIPKECVFAVDLQFDKEGRYRDFDHDSPMTRKGGKCDVVKMIAQKHKRILHVGDGLNDYAAHDLVTRFVGYGGAFHRDKVAAAASFYIECRSMLPLLPLGMIKSEQEKLNEGQLAAFKQGLALIDSEEVIIRDD